MITGAATSFTNAGTIIARDSIPAGHYASPVIAIAGGGTIVNSGTISLDGSIGIDGGFGNPATRADVTNSGTIGEIAGGRASVGVRGAGSILNSRTIVTSGLAQRERAAAREILGI
ncbi:hypothetical protein [Sphingomonas sp.]|uniref:hypothetical protein n=1 Tax=Sphingomonas sp. TaxID=28214 RepID=UPI00286C3265|nr:hypothetical protein [Sphingomonas sp.]